MRNRRGIFGSLCGFVFLGLAFWGSPGPKAEAAGEPYTYQAVFHAGVQGTFRGTDGVEVTPADPSVAGLRQTVLSGDGKTITVTGLQPGDRIFFDVALAGAGAEGENTDAVELGDGSRYYVKGLLKSGRDGKNPLDGALPAGGIQEDLDYTVSYGIRGEMTGYTVEYRDVSGRELAPGRKYSGNVGDRPVAAYLYIEGYRPQAYNLTKTLVKNEAENVMVFVYTPVRQGERPGETVRETERALDSAETEVEVEEEVVIVETETEPGRTAVQGTPGADNEERQEAEMEELSDEQVPEGPPELLDLDDEEVPLSSGGGMIPEESGEKERAGGGIMYGLLAAALAGTAILAGFVVWLWKNRKEEEED